MYVVHDYTCSAWKVRQENWESEAILGYAAKPQPKTNKSLNSKMKKKKI